MMRRETAANGRVHCQRSKLGASGDAAQGRPAVGTLATESSAPTGSSTRRAIDGRTCHSPTRPCRPRDACRPRRGRAATRAARRGRTQSDQRLADPEAGSPQHDEQRPGAQADRRGSGLPHDRDDLLDARRVGGIAEAFVPRRATREVPRQRRRRAPTPGGIQQCDRGHGPPELGDSRSAERLSQSYDQPRSLSASLSVADAGRRRISPVTGDVIHLFCDPRWGRRACRPRVVVQIIPIG